MSEKKNVVIERTYKARVEELWELWTTKDGFASWWGPQGFRVEVKALEAKLGGLLHYDMIADAPEVVEQMKKLGQPLSHETRGTFSEFKPHQRLALTHIIDFLPGVKPYDSTMVLELFPSGSSVRMVITLTPMHDAQTTQMQVEGFTSQLSKLDKRFLG
ncbi:MAG TPA: SRPBCC domain-containing protein [Hyalangium sp.]|nr:SRPBCC domain-containing protein [Hyalangium sp.]